ncbi:MAG: dynamin family protein [Bacillota bacterium]|nr:dynamin family protein [Bacillota bacterium]
MDLLDTTKRIQETFEGYELCRHQAEQVRVLAGKLEKKNVTIAVIGQFKRGKTSMINSILGRKLLPTGIVPITSAVTRIEYAEGETGDTAKVYFLNGLCEEVPAESLHEYISEQENHDNERGVAEVELLTEAAFLKDGLILVDTPGVGSIHENNSKSAYDFARESDGAIFMLSVDSPVNRIEVDFLKSVRRFAGKFYFTVNKIDTVDEEDLAEYLEYCTALIGDIMDPDGKGAKAVRLLPISAKNHTGIDELTEMIRDDLLNKAADIMRQSVGLKLLEILKNTGTQISSYREVLKMAPNVFSRRFGEMNGFLEGERKKTEELEDKKYLRARLNEEKACLSMKVRELFGIEYFYSVDRNDAAEFLSRDEYAAELQATYDELAETLNSIFMYKEENAYTVARRIEDLNILMQSMKKFTRQIERDMVQ